MPLTAWVGAPPNLPKPGLFYDVARTHFGGSFFSPLPLAAGRANAVRNRPELSSDEPWAIRLTHRSQKPGGSPGVWLIFRPAGSFGAHAPTENMCLTPSLVKVKHYQNLAALLWWHGQGRNKVGQLKRAVRRPGAPPEAQVRGPGRALLACASASRAVAA